MPERYEMSITATGEVRDADGNLLNTEVIETKVEMTEEQAAELGKALFNKENGQ